MNLLHEFCTNKKLSRKVQDAFTAYCRTLISEYYDFGKGETVTGLLFTLNEKEVNRLWELYLEDMKKLIADDTGHPEAQKNESGT